MFLYGTMRSAFHPGSRSVSMEKKFLSNVILLIGLNLMIKPLYVFGIDRSVQNEVGASAYGLYFALFNLVYLFQILNDFGIQNFNHSVFSKRSQAIAKYLPKILGAKGVLSVAFLGVTLAAGLLLGYQPMIWPLMLCIVLNQILASLLMLLRTSLSASGFYRWDSVLSVVDKLIMILVVGYWLLSQQSLVIMDFVYAQMASFVASILLATVVLKVKIGLRWRRARIDGPFIWWLLRRSAPYALVLLLMTLYTRMDGVMIEQLLPNGQEQAGIYAASYRILDAFNMIGVLFAGLLLPMFAKLIGELASTRELATMATRLLWTISTVVAILSFQYADQIIPWLYVEADVHWNEVYRWLMPTYIAVSLSYVYGTLLTANESIREMNQVFVLGVLLNFVLNWIWIQQWDALGAAYATLVTQTLTSLALIGLAIRKTDVRVNPLFVLHLLLFAITSWFLCQLIGVVDTSWQGQAILFLAATSLLAGVMRLVPVHELRHLLGLVKGT